MAIAGQPWGIFLWIAVEVAYDITLETKLEFAYKRGVNLINNAKYLYSFYIDAICILGLHDVCSCIATVINFEFLQVANRGEKMIVPRDILNQIPTHASSNLYCLYLLWLLGKKGKLY